MKLSTNRIIVHPWDPLSPTIANLVLQNLEKRAVSVLCHPVFYHRYVDDIVMSVPKTTIDSVLTTFNSFHLRIQFTMEIGGDKLNFLDVTLIRNQDKIEFNWYHKPTFSGRYLNFLSHHPISQKRGIWIG